jgi:dihydrodipicolinate reductase (EC 1.3.1.26)
MIRVAVSGACGRMGSKIVKRITREDGMEVVAAIEAPNTPFKGKDVGEIIGIGPIGVKVAPAEELEKTLKASKPDVVVDFTIADAAVNTVEKASKLGVNLVVGTTGFSTEQLEKIEKDIKEGNVKAIIAPNMAVGVNVFFKVLEELAKLLPDYNVEIMEAHHKHKKDAPSGTALRALEIIAATTGRDPDNVSVYGRRGLIGERSDDEIGVHAIRAGDIVGDHTVLFAGEGEDLK